MPNPYTIKFEYLLQNPCNAPNFVPLAITQHFDIQGANDAIETYSFVDGLGRVIQVKKDIVVNTAVNHTVPPAFVQGMSVSGWTSYDEFGRKTDQYNAGGNIYSIVNNDSYAYVSRSDYNYFGELAYQKYGNNTEAVYAYTDKLRRLNSINVKNSSAQILMSPVYSYDYIGNITAISNQGTTIGSFSMNNARYDSYNRFTGATGSFNDPVTNKSSTYNLSGMVYGSSGEILEKTQSHILQGLSNPYNSYNNRYDYVSSSHKILAINDQISGRTEQFSYDLNGNVAQRVIPTLEYNYGWDEENRLRTFTKKDKLGETTHLYYYDASGERIIKIKGTTAKLFQDADLTSAQLLLRDFTIYPSAFITQSDSKITKHYYAGTKRIASRIEMKTASEPNTGVDTELQLKQESDLMEIVKKLDCKEYKYEFNQFEAEVEDDDTIALRAEVPSPVFFYHPDHLGTSTVISNSTGAMHQYFFNLPFGETMIEGCSNTSYQLNYKFNGKELDAESNMYYYGARYYDPRISVWMSVDPLFQKNANFSPFTFCSDNPINNVDPNGLDDYELSKKGYLKFKKTSATHTVYALDKNGKRTGKSQTFKNKEMLDQLVGEEKVTKATGDENSQDEMVKAFLFFANNSDVEWRIDRYQENGDDKYALGNIHEKRLAPSASHLGHATSPTIAFIHSHPDTDGSMFDEISSMGYWGDFKSGNWENLVLTGDTYNKSNLPEFKNTIYQTYFPSSGRLWNVNKDSQPSYIRNIKSDYKRFFIGNLNTR